MEHFSEFAQENTLTGSKVKLDSILDEEITVIAYQIQASKYKRNNGTTCLKLQFEMDGEKHVTFTGSQVLARQCEIYKEHMPFLATITKPQGKYYTFS